MEAFSGSPGAWDELIAGLPQPHLLQTWEWAQVKEKYGWKARPLVWRSDVEEKPSAAAMVLERTLSSAGFTSRLRVLYIPKGPNLDWGNPSLRLRVLSDLQVFAKRQGAIFVKIDPDVKLGVGVPGSVDAREEPGGWVVQSELEEHGWRFSPDQIQFRNTVLIDLTPSEDEMLARMKQKTRYNIRLAEKRGVRVRAAGTTDLALLYRMYAETSVRDGFVIRGEDYYQSVWKTFHTGSTVRPSATVPFSEPLIAEVDGQPVAAISLFYFAGHAYYLYGMSRDAHREKMPNHLLQWEAMRRAKTLGCRDYNLWGAPNEFNENDNLWGVFRFKEGLGGSVDRTIGAWDFTAKGMMYALYTRILPRILARMRSRGKAKTRQSLGDA
jgi:lipid II:glycine glycyltransferase (peptidoglycan interpeptide bridge formation enzyme)